ncbi:MAG: hypothetical protein ACLRWQ_20890 [Flavonifractor plautii]
MAGTVYQASGAGILSFTMPKTDLTIAKADQQVKYTLGEGVSLTGTDYDVATGYAPVGTTALTHYCGPRKRRHRCAGQATMVS